MHAYSVVCTSYRPLAGSVQTSKHQYAGALTSAFAEGAQRGTEARSEGAHQKRRYASNRHREGTGRAQGGPHGRACHSRWTDSAGQGSSIQFAVRMPRKERGERAEETSPACAADHWSALRALPVNLARQLLHRLLLCLRLQDRAGRSGPPHPRPPSGGQALLLGPGSADHGAGVDDVEQNVPAAQSASRGICALLLPAPSAQTTAPGDAKRNSTASGSPSAEAASASDEVGG